MAKLYTKRLLEKFGKENVTGKKYGQLIGMIIAHNTEQVSKKIASIQRSKISKAVSKITPKTKRFIIPDISEVLPGRNVYIRKGAEKGVVLADRLRDNLTKDLRDTMNQFTLKTGEARFIRRRGKKAGTINPELIKDLEQRIQLTFENYTKKNPKFGVPSNIHQIAVTEMRSTINPIKQQFVEKTLEENPELEIRKSWIHNPSLSIEPRKGHGMMARLKPKRLEETYNVPIYKKIKGRLIRMGFEEMRYPHDPNGSAENVIGCNCDLEHIIIRR